MPVLEFKRFGVAAATLKFSELARDAETVSTFDPFLEKQKRYRALPVVALLARAFGEHAAALKKRSFVLRAKDGYAVPVSGGSRRPVRILHPVPPSHGVLSRVHSRKQ